MRIQKIREKLGDQKVDAILFTDPISIRYLCGYSGSNGLLFVSENRALFLTDFRYKTQAPREVEGAEVIVPDDGQLIDTLARRDEIQSIESIGFENSISFCRLEETKKKFSDRLEWKPIENIVTELRSSKTPDEIEKIRVAIDVAQKGLLAALPMLKPGIVEREFAAELEYRMRREGADKNAFDTIVVSGPRGALVHGVAGDRTIETGDFVTIDFGAKVNGYHSDITRTFIMGEPTDKQREIYELVYRAQAAAIDAAKANMTGKELDAVAREVIEKAGYGEYFGHGLGHGLGLEVHDPPAVGTRSENTLLENAVITIEPGVYIPDYGGVRIEDDFLLKKDGCEALTNLPKKIEDIIINID